MSGLNDSKQLFNFGILYSEIMKNWFNYSYFNDLVSLYSNLSDNAKAVALTEISKMTTQSSIAVYYGLSGKFQEGTVASHFTEEVQKSFNFGYRSDKSCGQDNKALRIAEELGRAYRFMNIQPPCLNKPTSIGVS